VEARSFHATALNAARRSGVGLPPGISNSLGEAYLKCSGASSSQRTPCRGLLPQRSGANGRAIGGRLQYGTKQRLDTAPRRGH
jgi:hypothetical protein